MSALKEMIADVCELYDMEGMTITQIAKVMDIPEQLVYEIVSDYADTWAPVL
jgi:DNA-directed RNA polymerase specialized sigma24 family protein